MVVTEVCGRNVYRSGRKHLNDCAAARISLPVFTQYLEVLVLLETTKIENSRPRRWAQRSDWQRRCTGFAGGSRLGG